MRYIHTTVRSELEIGKNFIRNFGRFNLEYKIDPLPIAVLQNVINTDTLKIKSTDNSINYRVNIYFNFIEDNSLCINGDNKKRCPMVGMVVNNQLIGIATMYNKSYYGSDYERFLVFEFSEEKVDLLEKYLKAINHKPFQSEIKN
jgi:hypothetical protein